MSSVLRSKYFWIALMIIVPFIIIWVMEGLAWAVGTMAVIGFMFLMILAGNSNRRRTRRYYYYEDEDEDEDEEIVERRRRPRRHTFSDSTRDLYLPPGLRDVHQKGLTDLGQRQREDYKRTMRRLRKL